METEFCLTDVTIVHRFQQRPLLQSISLNVSQGDRLGIVGASGAGKTLLLKTLNRFVNINQGSITYRNQSLQEYPVIPLRQQVLLVSAKPCLLEMTVAQTLQYPLMLRGIPTQDIQTRLMEAYERWQIPQAWLNLTEVNLTTAQRQWVSLLRAIIADPPVLLLDMPTSHLEDAQLVQLPSLLRQYSGTVLIADFNLEILRQSCDRILWLEQGSIMGLYPTEQVDWNLLQDRLQTNAAEQEDWV